MMIERRAHKRKSACIWVKYPYADSVSYGIATNISQKGMYIETACCFPSGPNLEILIVLHNDEVLTIPVNFLRLEKSAGLYDGFAVEVIDPSQDYSKFVIDMETFV